MPHATSFPSRLTVVIFPSCWTAVMWMSYFENVIWSKSSQNQHFSRPSATNSPINMRPIRTTFRILAFKLSACFECRMFSFGLFPGNSQAPRGAWLLLGPFYALHISHRCHFVPTRLWRWNGQNVPKRWHLNYRRRGTTQKKYNIPYVSPKLNFAR
jgi:hypothetical protein